MDEGLSRIDVSDWADVEPAELLLNPPLVLRHPPQEATARAIRYARAAAGATYDEIGFRLRAATPGSLTGPAALETFATARRRHEQATRRQAADKAGRLGSEQVMLRHRAIDFGQAGHVRFAVQGGQLHLTVTGDDGTEEIWAYALSHPPKAIRSIAVERDASPLVAQQLQVDAPGMRWLPLPLLIEAGRFRRMQEWAGQLETDTVPGRYYAFVSHRWLTPAHPDPEGRQAQFVAWQLVACLCEAIRVAQLRGLHEPRLESMGFGIGAEGSFLAESIIVNVLRHVLDDRSLEEAGADAAAVRELVRHHGATAAGADPGLVKLRAMLTERPALARLLARISVWYDYSCLPQPPRIDDEDVLFRQGLDALNVCQILGITLVLLDDAEDYLTRAWCTLEGLVADSFHAIDTLVGSQRPTAASGTVEEWFRNLMHDRPHIVWRALLDTEVFGVQDTQACFERLSLAVTDRDDLPFIYDRLRTLSYPGRVHTDESEIITGTLPLPALDDGRVLAARPGQAVGGPEPRPVGSLDWTDALTLEGAVLARQRIMASWSPRTSRADPADGAHLAVVAACEGEAVLVASWVETHLSELEAILGQAVVSMSWTASDIAPVGHLAEGALELRAVEAPVWVLCTVRERLASDTLASAIARAVTASGRTLVRLALDEAEDNIEVITPPRDHDPEPRTFGEGLVAMDSGAFGTRAGGLHRSTLVDILSGRADGRGAAQKLEGAVLLRGIPLTERNLLLQRLLAAHTTEDLKTLVVANLEQVLAAFPAWGRVPAQLREDPEATSRYVSRLILVAQLLDTLGHPGPLRALQGDRDENPIHRWQWAFAQSQALADAGDHADSIEVLSSLLSELSRVSGSAVDDLRPKVLGALGTAWFQAGDTGQALLWTERALEACLANGDSEGTATYRETLQVLEALQLPAIDPEAGARLLECRRLIAAAQSASDRFDYAASNLALGDTLAVISKGNERLRASFAGKIYGLRGWNHHYLGDAAAARADTERALAECHAASDMKGVRIYTANLEFLSQADGDAGQAPRAAFRLGLPLAEHRDTAGERAAFQQAIDSGDADAAATAAFDLGLLLADEGDVAGARAAYQQAIDSGHADAAPTAAFNLGLLLAEQGDVAGARTVYQQAIDSRHTDMAPTAAVNLGVLLGEQGDAARARAAYQLAIDSGHPEQAPKAAFHLGLLLAEQGDVAGARTAYQQAIDSGHPEQAPKAAFNLGLLLTDRGDLAGARTAYQQAIDSGRPEQASKAAANFGLLLAEQGDVAGARAAYQLAIDSGHPNAAPTAAFNLGLLLAEQGDVAGARTAYQQAIDSGHAEQAPAAAFNLGVLLAEQGDLAAAQAAFQQAIDSGHADVAPTATVSLGVVLEEQGDVAGARAAYQLAIDSGHADAAPEAAVNLGVLLEEQEDVAGARADFRQAIDPGVPDAAIDAAFNLGMLLKRREDIAAARAAYQLAIDSGHAEQAPKAAVYLGMLLERQGDMTGASAAYRQAIESGHADAAPTAALHLGPLLAEQGDVAGARAAFQLAIESGHADAAPKAAVNFGVLLKRQRDMAGARAAYQLAIDSGHVAAAPIAAVKFGQLLEAQGDVAAARAAYRQAIDSGHTEQAPMAALYLEELLEAQGDVDGARAAYQEAIDSGHADAAPLAALNLDELLEE